MSLVAELRNHADGHVPYQSFQVYWQGDGMIQIISFNEETTKATMIKALREMADNIEKDL